MFSSLTQPEPPEGTGDLDPFSHAFSGEEFTSLNGAVRFTIAEGSSLFAVGDTFTFTTTGKTAPSRGVTVLNRRITEGPTAVIFASRLAGDPPLSVNFDGRESSDPNGETLQFRWDFGDGSPFVFGFQPTHVFIQGRTYSVTLRVTNSNTGLLDEATVDIVVTNNSPNAHILASPLSGRAPLSVDFDGSNSSDTETTDPNDLVFQWDFGDGLTANNSGLSGLAFANVNHLYVNDIDGTPCSFQHSCVFTVTLTVTDEGGKQDTDTVTITVGNSSPVPSVEHTALQGPDPWEVVFNAINSFDPDGDPICIEWIWGDNTPNECWPRTGKGGATDGSVPHSYQLPDGQNNGSFSTRAIIRDYPEVTGAIPGCDGSCNGIETGAGSQVAWSGATVVVNAATVGPSDPIARFTINPDPPVLDEPFSVDGSRSQDFPAGGRIVSYRWNWDDGTPQGSGVTAIHTYTRPGTYRISLTVDDAEDPPNTNSTSRTVILVGEEEEDPDELTNRPPRAVILITPRRGPPGQEFTFDARSSSDPDGDELTYTWSFGDGSPLETGEVVLHSYASSGAYTVRLTVRDTHNGSTEATQEVIVTGVGDNTPPVALIATGPRTGTAPLMLSFDGRTSYDADEDPLTFEWVVKLNGLPTGTPVSEPVLAWVFELPGTYTVTLTVTDPAGGRATAEVTVMVLARSVGPDTGEEPTGGRVGPDADGRDSAEQRPLGAMCGLGMLMSLFGSLLGLTAMVATRRKFRM